MYVLIIEALTILTIITYHPNQACQPDIHTESLDNDFYLRCVTNFPGANLGNPVDCSQLNKGYIDCDL